MDISNVFGAPQLDVVLSKLAEMVCGTPPMVYGTWSVLHFLGLIFRVPRVQECGSKRTK